MKLIFDKSNINPTGGIGLIQAYLSYNKIYVRDKDITVSYNSAYDFWDISVFKCNRVMSGNGNKDWRAKMWEEQKERIQQLFPDVEMKTTFAWVDDRPNSTTRDEDQIPGIRFWLYVE